MGHLKTAKCECLWSSAEHRAEAVTCRGKNIFILKEKSSNLYIIMFCVSGNVSEYVFMHSALVCVHKYFTLTGGLKSGKCECLWSSAEHTAEAVTCQGKIYLSHSKNRQISTSFMLYVSENVSDYAFMHTAGTCVQKCFTREGHLKSPRTNVCETASKTQVKQLLARCTK